MSDGERSSPSALRRRTRLSPTYKLSRGLAPAVLAAVELLHAGVLVRFAGDAIIEALIARGLAPGRIVPMPRAGELTTPAAAQRALDDVLALCSAMDEAMVLHPKGFFALRSVTLDHFEVVARTFPRQPSFHWPPPRAHNRTVPLTPLRLHAPEMYLDVLPAWIAQQQEESTKFGVGRCVTLALERKLQVLGIAAGRFYKDPSLVVQRLEFQVLPSIEGTICSRSMEERFLAVIQALEEISASGMSVGLIAFRAVIWRLLETAVSASREE